MKKKILILLIVLIMFLCIFNIYINSIFKSNIPVLAYHDVLENPIEETDINIENFEKQMQYLYKHNYYL